MPTWHEETSSVYVTFKPSFALTETAEQKMQAQPQKIQAEDQKIQAQPQKIQADDQKMQATLLLLNDLPEERKSFLLSLLELTRNQRKIDKTQMVSIILELCKNKYFTVLELGTLLTREPINLRLKYLIPLVKNGQLTLLYPNQPTHPNQAYTSTPSK